jgi:hypothetical protein
MYGSIPYVSKYLCFTNVERNLKIGLNRAESRKVLDKAEDRPIIGLIRRYYHSNDREISFSNTTNEMEVDGGRDEENLAVQTRELEVRVGRDNRGFDWFRDGQLVSRDRSICQINSKRGRGDDGNINEERSCRRPWVKYFSSLGWFSELTVTDRRDEIWCCNRASPKFLIEISTST